MSEPKLSSQTKPRKRVKVECMKCGLQFDDDYRTKHGKIHHNGKRVQIKTVGAVSNPFEAAAKNKKQKIDKNDELLPATAQISAQTGPVEYPSTTASDLELISGKIK